MSDKDKRDSPSESDYFDLVYSGEIVPGSNLEQVKQRVAATFKLDAAAAQQLFSGEPMRLKRGIDKSSAEGIMQRLADAGAVAKLIPVAEESTASQSTQPLSLAPLGADVLQVADRSDQQIVPLPDLNHLTVEPIGSDILKQAELPKVKAVNPDISKLALQ